MAVEGEEPPELTALNANMAFIKSTIISELDWFSDKLVAKNFIKRERAGAVLRKGGNEDREFMDDVYKAIKHAGHKRERFDDFVDIFSHNAAYQELVKKLKRSVDGDQSGGGGGDRGQIRSEGPNQSNGGTSSGNTNHEELQEDMCHADWFELDSEDDPRAAEAFVANHKHIWQKKELRVFFMNRIPPWHNDKDDYISKEEILTIANEWHDCGPAVVPKFVRCPAKELSDIRVEFTAMGNPRSLVGIDALSKLKDEPTMWLKLASVRLYKRIIRHEFGHALGLQHEHQHPGCKRMYDHQKLKNYLQERYPRHSDREIENRIRSQWARIDGCYHLCTEHDSNSIMHYLIPDEVRAKGNEGPTHLPLVLSAKDKEFIVKLYSEDNAQEEAETEMETDHTRRNEGTISAEGGGESGEMATPTRSDGTSGARRNAGARKTNIKRDNLSDPIFDTKVENTLLIYLEYNDNGQEKELRIKKNIAPKWESLAPLLGFSTAEITIIKQSQHHQQFECCSKMLTEWMQRDLDCTWRKLIKKMRAVELTNDAEELAKALTNQIPS